LRLEGLSGERSGNRRLLLLVCVLLMVLLLLLVMLLHQHAQHGGVCGGHLFVFVFSLDSY
jgi:hypothetical protein